MKIYSNKNNNNNNNNIFTKYYIAEMKFPFPKKKKEEKKNKLVPHYYSFLFLKFYLQRTAMRQTPLIDCLYKYTSM